MENKDDVTVNNNENSEQPIKVVINDSENMEINIKQSDSPLIQLNFDKMDLNNSPLSPSSSINPAIADSDTVSDVDGNFTNNYDNTEIDDSSDNDNEDNPTSNFILYKKIESNNNDPIESLKSNKPSKSILKVTNVQPQKSNLFKKDWFKEKFGTSGNTISSAFKSFSNNANMVIERQITSLTNGQGTWKSKSNDSIYLNNYYNDSIGNTTAIDESTRINPEDEKKDICNSMDSFLHDIPKRVRFSFEDISTALANDENRLSYYQKQLQQIHKQQELLRNNPISITQRRDSLTHGHSVKKNDSPASSPGVTPPTQSPSSDTKPAVSENKENNNTTPETQNNPDDSATDNNSSDEPPTIQINPSSENDNAINDDEKVVEVGGVKEGDEVNFDELNNEEEEDEEEEVENEKPLVDPKDKHPLTPAQILKAYEIEWKRRNEKPIIPIINMLRKKINDNETTVPVIDIHGKLKIKKKLF
ncbi:hypothetical protein PIROE2DRAFT_60873 [Piromyces sp. E2]|nr:hypothetical protein PIROE2DRAFT_60873 [Piromyces sp. E2]|eukprot:OUM64142.1 hypothetical protein PIROE2DRAFT_60873 [Piromyces sp. E2]